MSYISNMVGQYYLNRHIMSYIYFYFILLRVISTFKSAKIQNFLMLESSLSRVKVMHPNDANTQPTVASLCTQPTFHIRYELNVSLTNKICHELNVSMTFKICHELNVSLTITSFESQ